MANIPITQLPNADPLTGTELVPIVQNGVTVRTTTQAISLSPSLNQTFLTVGLESTLPNSRYFSTDNSLTITDNGPQSFFRIGLTGAVADFNSIGNGFVVKTSPTSLLNRSIAVANAGLSITDGSGLSGNPTLSLSGLPLSLAQASGSGLLSLDSGSTLSPVAITGTAGQISVANGTGVGGNPTLSLDATGVVSGSYTLANITVDGYGRITSASNGSVAGTVSSVTVINANGFSGNVSDPTGNASITIETTVTGILKGNGTAISAATSGVDYAPATSGTSILYGDGSGGFSNVTVGSGLSFAGGTLSATGGGGSVTAVTASAPLSSSGGTTPDISITQAGVATDGYLSSTDWNTFNNKGSGTVTSVGLTAGTGISVSGSPITGSGSITVTNTAPDQVVTLTAGSNVTITGTYPSFTIAATGGGGGSGTVTSVGLALPSEFTVTNSPVTTSGTLTGAWASQTQNYVLASPNGSSGTPSFRALVSADIPALNYAPPTSGTDILYGNGTGGFSNVTVGTGLSFTGGTLSNSAPDQTVTLTAGTGISTSGTYPSFTITNTAPDQVVSLTAGANISITGTYPSFTIAATGLPTGDVVGPASATDNAIARFDGTTGKLIQNSAVTIADDGATVISVNSSADALRITQTGSGNAIRVEDAANPDATPTVIDQNGRVIVGGATPYNADTVTPKIQVVTDTVFDGGFGGSSWSSDANGQITWFAKSKSGTIGSHSAVTTNDVLMDIRNYGSDGTAFAQAARIVTAVDGTVASNSVPSRITFSTTAVGGTSATERMRIDSAGQVGIGTTPTAARSLVIARNLTGATTAIQCFATSVIQSDVTSNARAFSSNLSTAAASFTLADMRHFYAFQGTLGAGSTVTNQYGFWADASLVGATNNYGFYSSIPSGSGRWNFYADGTAANFFGGPTTISVNTTSDALRITQTGTGNALLVEDAANPDVNPTVIDQNGRVIVGNTVAVTSTAGGATPSIQNQGFGDGVSGYLSARYDASSNAPQFYFAKSRNATVGSHTIVTNGDATGVVSFSGSDGINFIPTAFIASNVDGTPGTNDMPGRLSFWTTAAAASASTERMRIDSVGNVGIGRTAGVGVRLDVGGTYGSTGTNESYGIFSRGTVPSTSTAGAYAFLSQLSTQDAAFSVTSITHYGTVQGTITGGSRTTPSNQIGFLAASNLTGASNNFGFYGNIASGSGRWNFFANGTAANYFAGTTLIGNTTDRGGSLQLAGSTSSAATTQRITGFAFDSRLRLGRANASETIVASGDSIGILAFDGYDGASYLTSAQISAVVDGTPGTNDMPGRLVFSTTADGASSPTERFRISSFGGWGLAGANYGTSGTQAIVSNGNASAPTWQDVVTPTASQTLTNKTLTSPTVTGATLNDGYTEEVYAVVDAAGVALSPTNGSIQTWTLGANRTPTAGTWAAGQSITMMINDSGSSFTVTWTTIGVTWVGGSAPSLAPASGFTIITLWKVGTTIYGALVGQVT